MTPEQLAALKQQIKAEVINELQQQPKSRLSKPWDEIKDIIVPRLRAAGLDTYQTYQAVPAISTILRYSLNIRYIANMTSDKLPEAKRIATTILDLMTENNETKTA
jgi:hypothetical protein